MMAYLLFLVLPSFAGLSSEGNQDSQLHLFKLGSRLEGYPAKYGRAFFLCTASEIPRPKREPSSGVYPGRKRSQRMPVNHCGIGSAWRATARERFICAGEKRPPGTRQSPAPGDWRPTAAARRKRAGCSGRAKRRVCRVLVVCRIETQRAMKLAGLLKR